MTTTLFLVAMVILTALVFDFTNGFHDSANAMATSVATGALKPRTAVLIAAVLNVVGAFLSTEVAKTISGGIVNDALVTPTMIFAGLVGAILWNLMTWLFGLPSSSSHALFGGLIGAVLVGAGASGVNFSVVVSKILLPAVVAPLVAGLAAGAGHLPALPDDPARRPGTGGRLVPARRRPCPASMVALAHGTSDGQKTMGVITLVLITAGYQESGTGPQIWVIAAAGPGHRPRHLLRRLADHADHGQGHRRRARPAGLRRRDHLGGGHPGVLAHGLRAVHHPGLLRLDHRLRRRPEAGRGPLGHRPQDGLRLAAHPAGRRPGRRRSPPRSR